MDVRCIVVRHGDYDGNLDLSPAGRGQMLELAQAIKEANTANLPIRLLCSTAARAQQGGEILAEELGIPSEYALFAECLWDDDRHSGNKNEARNIVDQNLVEDSLLLVLSHLDFVPLMASHVARRLGLTDCPWQTSKYGRGWVVTSLRCSPFPA